MQQAFASSARLDAAANPVPTPYPAAAALDAEGMSASALGYTWWAVWFQFFLLGEPGS